MSRVALKILLVLVMVINDQVNCFISAIGDIATISNFANDALAFCKGDLPLENLMMGSTGFALDTIINKMGEMSTQLEEMEANNERRMNHMLETLMNRLPLENKVEIGLTELHTYIVRIDGLFEKFQHYSKDLKKFNEKTIKNFIETVISHEKGGLQDVLDYMHRLMRPDRSSEYRKPLQQLVHQKNLLMSFGELCGTTSSPQQRLFEIYRTVFVSESRVFTMNLFSYAMRMVYENASYVNEMKLAASQYVTRANDYLLATKAAMENSSLAVDVCDPEVFERGKNFVELEGAIQMYVGAEASIGWNGNNNPCARTCPEVSAGGLRTNHCKFNDNKWCQDHDCYGRIFDCVSSSSTAVCAMPPDSSNRYVWVKDGYSNSYGNTNTCPGRMRYPDWYNSGFSSCDICICTCADDKAESPAVRAISLRPVLSNIKENKVVTGIKFISSDKLIQIRIEEGELLPGGSITDGSERWVDIERFEYTEKGVTNGQRHGGFYLLKKQKKTLLQIDTDYSFITYYQRNLNLDELMAPFGYVITGVKFQHEAGNTEPLNRRRLELAIRVTKFDFASGVLETDDDSSYWITQETMPGRLDKYDNGRTKLDVSGADNPTKRTKHVQISGPGLYVQFAASDRKKDAGQATIPFFDGQAVTTSISIPLSGLALLHRGASGSGGFLTFRLFTLNLFKYMNAGLDSHLSEQFDATVAG